MSEYKIDIIDTIELPPDSFGKHLAETTAAITIEPPVKIGPAFSQIILGKGSHGVRVEEAVTTDDRTVLIAESTNTDPTERSSQQIRLVAERIGRLLNDPRTAIIMRQETPFALYQQAGPGDVSGHIGRGGRQRP